MTDIVEPPRSDARWQRIADTEGYQELVRRRHRLVRTSLIISVLWFGTFLILTTTAEGFMREQIVDGLSVAYVLGLSQFVLVWVVVGVYIRTAERVFEPLERATLTETARGGNR